MPWQQASTTRSHAILRQVPHDRLLNSEFWLRFGSDSEPSMREKIILVTLDDVGRVGAATFNVKLVCDALGVSYSLINHHFGSRDELIAETAVRWYSLYVTALWSATLDAVQTPEERLRSWLLANVDWSTRYSGLSALLDYPTASSDATEMINRNHRQRLTDLAELNLARLMSLVLDVRRGEVGLYALDAGSIPREALMGDDEAVLAAGAIAWAILGMSVWKAGQHLPTTQVEGVTDHVSSLSEFYINRLIDLARSN